MFGKGQIENNKIAARLAKAAMEDNANYVRPPVLAMLRDKIGGEAYYLFLRNNATATWEEKAEILLATCPVCEKGFSFDEWEERHQPHEEGCGYPEIDMVCFCNCDLNVHADCCLECAK